MDIPFEHQLLMIPDFRPENTLKRQIDHAKLNEEIYMIFQTTNGTMEFVNGTLIGKMLYKKYEEISIDCYHTIDTFSICLDDERIKLSIPMWLKNAIDFQIMTESAIPWSYGYNSRTHYPIRFGTRKDAMASIFNTMKYDCKRYTMEKLHEIRSEIERNIQYLEIENSELTRLIENLGDI